MKLIDKISNRYLVITCSFVINKYDCYIIPTIVIGKICVFHIIFHFLNMIFELDFEIKHYDS